METIMQNLNDYNEKRREMYAQFDRPVKNGVACPECGSELYDSHPSVTLTSWPPQKTVHCENCEYKGYRIS